MNYIFKKRNSDTSSETSSIYSNIFRSKKEITSITFLNRYSDESFYEKIDKMLEKTFFNRALFDYELYILLMLDKIKLNIVPEILHISDSKSFNLLDRDSSKIMYNINEMISLREAFEKNFINFHYLINELLTFLKMIQNSKLLIGNLNIDTIYVKNTNKLVFYIIDFSKANFTDKILDLDFQSLYISLNEGVSAPLQRVNQNNLNYFNQEFNRYTNKRLSKESFADSIISLYNN